MHWKISSIHYLPSLSLLLHNRFFKISNGILLFYSSNIFGKLYIFLKLLITCFYISLLFVQNYIFFLSSLISFYNCPFYFLSLTFALLLLFNLSFCIHEKVVSVHRTCKAICFKKYFPLNREICNFWVLLST